jgi:hypothetical protein
MQLMQHRRRWDRGIFGWAEDVALRGFTGVADWPGEARVCVCEVVCFGVVCGDTL